ncbi:MerR family transcriptional regulator [Endozoicomonas sp. (ex Bugula neritina AB1)]|nr:MerR family transcriptional regulator [Endozoicomonas sp. (ex Bugula neritina AB1)]
MPSTTYTISELAKEFNITPRTIRFYEDQELLAPVRDGQHRIYSPGDRVRLKLIVRGKRLGFSLSESKDVIRLYDPTSSNKRQLEAMLTTIDESRQRLQQQMKDIRAMKKELDDAEQRCLKALNT